MFPAARLPPGLKVFWTQLLVSGVSELCVFLQKQCNKMRLQQWQQGRVCMGAFTSFRG